MHNLSDPNANTCNCNTSCSSRNFSSQIPVEKQTKFELFLHLINTGWELDSLSRKDYFSPGQAQTFSLSGTFYQEYLLTLLQCEGFFKKGLEKIYHAQSKSYYITLRALCGLESDEHRSQLLKTLQPNQPANSYKKLLKQLKSGGRRQKQQHYKPHEAERTIEVEDDACFLPKASVSANSSVAGEGAAKSCRTVKRQVSTSTASAIGGKPPPTKRLKTHILKEVSANSAAAANDAKAYGPAAETEDTGADSDTSESEAEDIDNDSEAGGSDYNSDNAAPQTSDIAHQYQRLASTLTSLKKPTKPQVQKPFATNATTANPPLQIRGQQRLGPRPSHGPPDRPDENENLSNSKSAVNKKDIAKSQASSFTSSLPRTVPTPAVPVLTTQASERDAASAGTSTNVAEVPEVVQEAALDVTTTEVITTAAHDFETDPVEVPGARPSSLADGNVLEPAAQSGTASNQSSSFAKAKAKPTSRPAATESTRRQPAKKLPAKALPAQDPAERPEAASMFSLSTVWIGNLAVFAEGDYVILYFTSGAE